MTFTFSFEDASSGVSGLISGLGEGSNPCNTTQPSCQVFVLNARNQFTVGLYRVDETAASDGFEVSPQGVITSADFFAFKFVDTPLPKAILLKFSQNRFVGLPGVADETPVGCLDEFGESFACLTGTSTRGVATFTRVPDAVPGPVPLLGAAAAFSASRRLRRRIKVSSNTVPTAPFA